MNSFPQQLGLTDTPARLPDMTLEAIRLRVGEADGVEPGARTLMLTYCRPEGLWVIVGGVVHRQGEETLVHGQVIKLSYKAS